MDMKPEKDLLPLSDCRALKQSIIRTLIINFTWFQVANQVALLIINITDDVGNLHQLVITNDPFRVVINFFRLKLSQQRGKIMCQSLCLKL